MGICRIKNENMKEIAPLFAGWNETLIWSCLQGCMGTAWADNKTSIKSAQIVVADFCFFTGEVCGELIRNKPAEHRSDFIIMVPPDEKWAEAIEKIYGADAKRTVRYAIKKEKDIFGYAQLEHYAASLPEEYELKFIDENLYNESKKEGWSDDLCSQFETYEDYKRRGIGAGALHNGVMVSGASSYTVYNGGIEIEIDTRKDYRRRGLALACAAKLILECRKRNLYPSWDAQNLHSVGLAEKLGYHFDREYTAYEVRSYGRV